MGLDGRLHIRDEDRYSGQAVLPSDLVGTSQSVFKGA